MTGVVAAVAAAVMTDVVEEEAGDVTTAAEAVVAVAMTDEAVAVAVATIVGVTGEGIGKSQDATTWWILCQPTSPSRGPRGLMAVRFRGR